MIQIHFSAPFRPTVKGFRMVNAIGENIREILENLECTYPGLRQKIFNTDGDIKKSIHIFVNSKDVRFLRGTQTQVKDGDVILILSDVMGG